MTSQKEGDMTHYFDGMSYYVFDTQVITGYHEICGVGIERVYWIHPAEFVRMDHVEK